MTTTAVSPADVEQVTEDLKVLTFALYTEQPFWALLLERCDIMVSYHVPTAGITEDSRLYINPEWWGTLTDRHKVFILAHEVGHVAFQHHSRLRGWTDPIPNIAADYAINYTLCTDMGLHSMPEGGWYDARFADMVAEEIANILRQEGGYENLSAAPQDLLGNSDAPGDGDTQMVREARDAKPRTKEEWDAAVAQAAQRSRMEGRMSAGLERMVDRHLSPQIDWVEQLNSEVRHHLATVGRDHYRMVPPNRRHVWQDLYLPSMYDLTLKLAIAVDTSGSMSDEDMGIAYAEINEIRRRMNAHCYVMSSDADIAEGAARWVHPYEELPAFVGGGGTDFRPVFDHIEEHRLSPDLLVFFTDTGGAFPDSPPEYPVLWVIHGQGQVPWGKFIHVGSYT